MAFRCVSFRFIAAHWPANAIARGTRRSPARDEHYGGRILRLPPVLDTDPSVGASWRTRLHLRARGIDYAERIAICR